MENETALNPNERKAAAFILRFLTEVQDVAQTRNFLSRIVAEDEETDPNSAYRCDICGHIAKGREGKRLSFGAFVCKWCSLRESMYGEEWGE